MIKYSFYYIILSLFIFSCKSGIKSNSNEVLPEESITKYLSIPIYQKPCMTLEDASASNSNLSLYNQVYETLFQLNPNTQNVEPLLISSYTKDSSRTLYTFRLRENIYFHDDPCFPQGKGRKVSAADIVYCFNRLGKPWIKELSYLQNLDSNVVDTLNSTHDALPLIASISENSTYDFTIQLNKRDSTFLKKLCQAPFYIYPKEIHTTYYNSTKPVFIGTGPFIYSTYKDQVYFLLQNTNYYLPNTPKIEGLRLVYCKSDSIAYYMYKNGLIDLYYSSDKKDKTLDILPDIVNFDYFNLQNWDFKNTLIQETQRLVPVN